MQWGSTILIANTWLPTYPDVAVDSLGGVHVVWQYGCDGENNLLMPPFMLAEEILQAG